ncbi:MAG TPA: KxYKxGKxW signal peptide domain-containing protein [Verrucomicrobiae bacterium]|jgi:hypothetical protein
MKTRNRPCEKVEWVIGTQVKGKDDMKANNQPADTQHAKQSMSLWKSGKLWLAAAIGMGVGVAAAAGYLLSGGEHLLFIPQWAKIIFYPGFVAGEKAANLGWGVDGGKVVGVMTVGLCYAGVAVLIRLALLFAKRKE